MRGRGRLNRAVRRPSYHEGVKLPVYYAGGLKQEAKSLLQLDPEAATQFLVRFLQDECVRVRGVSRVVVGLSGGLDSAVTAALCARAFGPEQTHVFLMPYKISSPESRAHAEELVDQLGLQARVIDITEMVDGYVCNHEVDLTPQRLGNICSRCRMITLFDQSAKLGGLPIGTGNKTERLFGYYTWHGDDSPPVNPLGDLFKTQVYQIAEFLEIPKSITAKPPTADLVQGQTDEGDLGVDYPTADSILALMLRGYTDDRITGAGYDEEAVRIVRRRMESTHWKRERPTSAMMSSSAIGETYLRPVDYRGDH